MNEGLLNGIYRREGDWNLVEMKVSRPAQLFNSLDPSPFRERDLDAEAADYLVDAIRELHGHRHVKIVVYLPDEADDHTRDAVSEAIQNYFRYRETAERFHLRQVMRGGRISLLVGLVFLVVCMTVWAMLSERQGVADQALAEGVLIVGWVALWQPVQFLLYDWWPVLTNIRLYRRISGLPVEVRQYVPSARD